MDGQYIASDGKLKMRALTLEDSQLIVDWRNNPRVRSRYIYREPFTLEGQERYFHEKVESGQVAQFIFCEERSGEASTFRSAVRCWMTFIRSMRNAATGSERIRRLERATAQE